jgi:SIR2-like protein
MRPKNDNNVYIIGAGFSVEAGLPTLASFLNRMRDAIDWLESKGRHEERTAIEKVLDFRHQSGVAGYRISLDLDNVESLFSLAEAQDGSGNMKYIQVAIAATIDFATQTGPRPLARFEVNPNLDWPCTDAWRESAARWGERSDGRLDVVASAYDYCTAVMTGLTSQTTTDARNTIVSFNYDLVVEDSLRRLGIPVCYGFGEGIDVEPDLKLDQQVAGPIDMLKLHGSLNWGVDLDRGVVVCSDYQRVRELELAPMLMPPTWNKSAWNAFQYVWSGAMKAIESATRIVIIGFSIPPTDQHFKYLLAAGLAKNSSLRSIRIVDPRCLELQAQYEGVLRSDQFKSGIVSTCRLRTLDYFYDEAELMRIGRSSRHQGLAAVQDYRGLNL